MTKHGAVPFFYVFLILIFTMNLLCKAANEDRKAHIVYLGSIPNGEFSPLSHHLSILQRVVHGSSPENLLIRSYKRSFNGFAAKLTDQEREKLANMKDVVSVFQSRTFQLQTTRSWDFMGFTEKVSGNATVGSDIIVGVFDSGIWPESESFEDKGFGPPPKKWKGALRRRQKFHLQQLIGARYYSSESARDFVGHGTHTASTVAGNAVKNVSFYGLANGDARGGVPGARIAAYKVCEASKCTSHSILAGFDDAIADGVDIITISIGPYGPIDLHQDAIAIGAFHAMKKGILTSQAAGNGGPDAPTVSSAAPWILTVAASSIDRRIVDRVVLANGTTLVGNSVNTFTLNGTNFPLIYGKDCDKLDAGYSVKGKIVLCDINDGYIGAYDAGPLGSVLLNFYEDDSSGVLPLPALTLMEEKYNVVMAYMNSTRNPQANILQSEVRKDPAAPTVSGFSSRGPNIVLPDIIKPDISAPGAEILAAFSPVASITDIDEDKRRVKYNILSGTSMSCPHAAAVAAYVKTFWPDWSPEAIKSSIMTTAWPMNDTSNSTSAFASSGEFAYGSGHINPLKAVNPGLVYEASEEDYINLLCKIYDEAKVRLISGDNTTCTPASDKGPAKDHNYPSMGAKVAPTKPFTIKFHRRVKNVGLANSTYKAKILSNSKVDIQVAPEVLSFKSLNEEKTFDVTVVGSGLPDRSQVSGNLVWSDGIHSARSPIVVYAYNGLDE